MGEVTAPAEAFILGQVEDDDGRPLLVGAHAGRVFIAGHFLSREANDQLAQLWIAATWHAETFTCPADCGGEVHDQACQPQPHQEGTPR